MKKQRFIHQCFLIPLIILSVFLLSSCDQQGKEPVQVSLKKIEELSPVKQKQQEKLLRIAISAVISPKETFILYKELLNYISSKLNLSVKLIQRETYEEINNLVKDNELEMAFVCSGAYVSGHDQFGMELLVAPVVHGESVYHSYIIVPASSKVSSFEELRGKRFAFTDPMSNTGKLAPTYMLNQMKEKIDTFFASYTFTYSHDRSIEMVAHSLVDGAAVDGLIWDYINIKKPKTTQQTKIIKKSEPYGIPPIVVSHDIDPQLKENLRNLLLNIHNDEVGKEILAKLMIEKFIIIDDSRYNSIRKMNSFIEQL